MSTADQRARKTMSLIAGLVGCEDAADWGRLVSVQGEKKIEN